MERRFLAGKLRSDANVVRIPFESGHRAVALIETQQVRIADNSKAVETEIDIEQEDAVYADTPQIRICVGLFYTPYTVLAMTIK